MGLTTLTWGQAVYPRRRPCPPAIGAPEARRPPASAPERAAPLRPGAAGEKSAPRACAAAGAGGSNPRRRPGGGGREGGPARPPARKFSRPEEPRSGKFYRSPERPAGRGHGSGTPCGSGGNDKSPDQPHGADPGSCCAGEIGSAGVVPRHNAAGASLFPSASRACRPQCAQVSPFPGLTTEASNLAAGSLAPHCQRAVPDDLSIDRLHRGSTLLPLGLGPFPRRTDDSTSSDEVRQPPSPPAGDVRRTTSGNGDARGR